MKIRISAKALIVREGRLLAARKEDRDGSYYILIGGGQKFGETLHETVRRECLEEAGIDVEPGEMLLMREYIGNSHEFASTDAHRHAIEHMFICRALGEPDPARAVEPDEGQVGVEWLPLEQIEEYRLYPQSMRAALREYFLRGVPLPAYWGNVN